MEKKMKVPKKIQAIIDETNARTEEENRRIADKNASERRAYIEQGIQLYDQYYEQVIHLVPSWMCHYLVPVIDDRTENELADAGRYKVARIKRIHFNIPGLSGILFDPEENRWMAQTAYFPYDEKPSLGYRNDSCWRSSCEVTLAVAAKEYQDHLNNLAEFEKRKQERAKDSAAYAQREAQAEQMRIAQDQKAQDEIAQLVNAFRDDPVMVGLLKVCVGIAQERAIHEVHISQMDDHLYSMEERFSRKAADLRRQAEDAERQAEEERRRANDIEDDLDAMKKKEKLGF